MYLLHQNSQETRLLSTPESTCDPNPPVSLSQPGSSREQRLSAKNRDGDQCRHPPLKLASELPSSALCCCDSTLAVHLPPKAASNKSSRLQPYEFQWKAVHKFHPSRHGQVATLPPPPRHFMTGVASQRPLTIPRESTKKPTCLMAPAKRLRRSRVCPARPLLP